MSWSPTTAPHGDFETVYLVMDSFGAHGIAYRETDVERTDLETVIADLMAGEFNAPVRVIASTCLGIGPTMSRSRSPKKSRNDATSQASRSLTASGISSKTTPAQPGNWLCGSADDRQGVGLAAPTAQPLAASRQPACDQPLPGSDAAQPPPQAQPAQAWSAQPRQPRQPRHPR